MTGREGTIVFEDTAGTFQYASPLTFDFTEDGRDDALVVANIPKSGGPPVGKHVNEMRVFDPHTQKEYRFREQKPGSNLGSTPLLTDLDEDGYLDVIYCYMDAPGVYFSFESLTIERIETRIKLDGPVEWGQYMGAHYNSVYVDLPQTVLRGSQASTLRAAPLVLDKEKGAVDRKGQAVRSASTGPGGSI